MDFFQSKLKRPSKKSLQWNFDRFKHVTTVNTVNESLIYYAFGEEGRKLSRRQWSIFFLLMAEYVVFMHYDFNESNLSVLSLCGNPFREIDNDRKNLYISLVSDVFFFKLGKILASSDMLK